MEKLTNFHRTVYHEISRDDKKDVHPHFTPPVKNCNNREFIVLFSISINAAPALQ